MFEGLANGAEELLTSLESKLPILSDADQGFVIGCRHHISAGAMLTDENVQELKRIANKVSQANHNMLGATEPPLTIKGMLQTLGKNLQMLQPHELSFAKKLALKIRGGQTIQQEELEQLIQLYTSKGF